MHRPLVRRVCVMAATAVALLTMGGARAAAPDAACTPRILVFSAYPAEVDAVLGKAGAFDKTPVVADGQSFYLGTVGGKPVIMAMTGIGILNARQAAEAAFGHFTCDGRSTITAVLFSGVAGGGGRALIGDVSVARRWTLDDGKTWRAVNPGMLAAATAVAAGGAVHLEQTTPTGDPACVCSDLPPVHTVDMGRATKIVVGGDGISSDTYGDTPQPCIPRGGNLFGCEPCRVTQGSTPDPAATAQGAADWVTFNFRPQNAPAAASDHVYESVDQETAAVQVVADRHHTPFLGFRGISDGPGDPLPLPGFPVEFFFYQQLAANNAATATAAFIAAWTPPSVGAVTTNGGNGSAGKTSVAGHRQSTAPDQESSPGSGTTAPAGVLGDRVTEPPSGQIAGPPLTRGRPATGDESVDGVAAIALVALATATVAWLRARRRFAS
jgi:nucleoside phosphorylase